MVRKAGDSGSNGRLAIMDATTKPLLAALHGGVRRPVPLWLMRQAGRYLPEYRALRAETRSFLDLCYSPARAAEASLQPVRRFGLDGAILFSDILVVVDALGVKVSFVDGKGPCLDPVRDAASIPAFDPSRQCQRLAPVYEAVERVVDAVPHAVTVLGFAGAPWTVATYMVEGGRSRDFAAVKGWACQDLDGFARLIETLREATAAHLIAQLDAGAEAVQIFDSWAGVLSETAFERWCVDPVRRLVADVRAVHPTVPIIGYPRGAGVLFERFVTATGVDAVSIDSTVPPGWAAERLQPLCAVQGNLDPAALLVGGLALEREAAHVLDALGHGPLVFNLGEGVLSRTPPRHVAALRDIVGRWRGGDGS